MQDGHAAYLLVRHVNAFLKLVTYPVHPPAKPLHHPAPCHSCAQGSSTCAEASNTASSALLMIQSRCGTNRRMQLQVAVRARPPSLRLRKLLKIAPARERHHFSDVFRHCSTLLMAQPRQYQGCVPLSHQRPQRSVLMPAAASRLTPWRPSSTLRMRLSTPAKTPELRASSKCSR